MKRPSFSSSIKIPSALKPTFFRLMSLYPPYLGAGIHITHVAEDLLTFDVELRLSPLNRNYVGSHFGGSLYSMADPFFMLMLTEALGRGYIVWDQAATIQFLRPGRGRVHARFAISPAEVDSIRAGAQRQHKVSPTFKTRLLDDEGEVVAEIDKILYVRRKATKANRPS